MATVSEEKPQNEGYWEVVKLIWSRIFPTGFWNELKHLWKLAAPILGHGVFQILLWIIPAVFGGHLGSVLITDGIILSLSVMTVFGICVMVGLGTACDTYFSVAYTTDKTRMGVILQAALIVFGIVLLPVIALFLVAGLLLYWVGQDPIVASYCQLYSNILIPGIIAAFIFRIVQRFTLSQDMTLPTWISSAALGFTTLILHFILVTAFDLAVIGSAISTTLAFGAQMLVMLIFCVTLKAFKDTWTGWSSESLLISGNIAWLGLTGLLSTASDMWITEIGIFFSGFLGPTYQAAQTIMVQFMMIWFQLTFCTSTALSIRTGQYLGMKNILAIKTAARVAVLSTCAIVVLGNCVLLIFRDIFCNFYTDNKEVANLAIQTMPFQSLQITFDGLTLMFKGILYGTGHQSYSFFITVVGYYCLGLPLGLILMFLTSLKLTGFWLGMSAGALFQFIVAIVITSRLDWENEILRAKERVKSKQDKSLITATESTPLTPMSSGEGSGDRATTDDKAQLIDDNLVAYKRKLRVATVKILVVAFAMTFILVAAIIIRVLFGVPPPYELYSITTAAADNVTISFNSTSGKLTTTQLSIPR